MLRTDRLKVPRVMRGALACAVTLVAIRGAARWLAPFEAQPFDAGAWATALPWERAPMARGAIRR